MNDRVIYLAAAGLLGHWSDFTCVCIQRATQLAGIPDEERQRIMEDWIKATRPRQCPDNNTWFGDTDSDGYKRRLRALRDRASLYGDDLDSAMARVRDENWQVIREQYNETAPA